MISEATQRGIYFLLLLVQSFLCAGALCVEAPEREALWTSALQAYQSKEYDRSVDLFTQWIDESASRDRIASPEAHYNLALAEWWGRHPGPAVYQLLQSAYLQTSPVKIAHAVKLLTEMEKSLGIKDSVPEELGFFFSLWLNGSWLLTLGTLSFWALCAFLWILWNDRERSMGTARAFLAIHILLALTIVGALPFSRLFARYGVLISEKGPIPLFRSPEPSAEGALVNLPEGTLVSLGKNTGGFLQITRPFAGWVPEDAVKRIAPDRAERKAEPSHGGGKGSVPATTS